MTTKQKCLFPYVTPQISCTQIYITIDSPSLVFLNHSLFSKAYVLVQLLNISSICLRCTFLSVFTSQSLSQRLTAKKFLTLICFLFIIAYVILSYYSKYRSNQKFCPEKQNHMTKYVAKLISLLYIHQEIVF